MTEEIIEATCVELDPVPVPTGWSDEDIQRLVATTQELIRQRGFLMQDLEAALNCLRTYQRALDMIGAPDPSEAIVTHLLQKYRMYTEDQKQEQLPKLLTTGDSDRSLQSGS